MKVEEFKTEVILTILWNFCSFLFFLSNFIPNGWIDFFFEEVCKDGMVCLKEGSIWLVGEKDRTETVRKLVVKLIDAGVIDSSIRCRIICIDRKNKSIADESFYPSKLMLVGERGPQLTILLYKFLIRRHKEVDRIGYFQWRRFVEERGDEFMIQAESVVGSLK